jgi:hypothetical protein
MFGHVGILLKIDYMEPGGASSVPPVTVEMGEVFHVPASTLLFKIRIPPSGSNSLRHREHARDGGRPNNDEDDEGMMKERGVRRLLPAFEMRFRRDEAWIIQLDECHARRSPRRPSSSSSFFSPHGV